MHSLAPNSDTSATRAPPAEIIALDAQDPLAPLRGQFELPPGIVYLDGNSLGALPKAVPDRLERMVRKEWAYGLIRSWAICNWINLPQSVGAKIARLIGAAPHEVIAGDSTSINIFKLILAAAHMQPGRRHVLTELGDFPTDLYMIEGAASLPGGVLRLRACEADRLMDAMDASVALVLLPHVNYKSGRLHDMAAITRRAHDVGALILWDLCHTAGAIEVDLNAAGADFAVGCGYKYLNGGPGAPAFLFIAERHHEQARSPLTGWMGHADRFAFEDHYRPAPGIARFLCGTPAALGLASLDASLDAILGADLRALAAKGRHLGDVFIRLVEEHCAGYGLEVASPRDSRLRGSHVALRHPQGHAIMQALIEAGVIGDFRAPDILRFGFAPLYVRYVDVWRAVCTLRDIVRSRSWDHPRFHHRGLIT